MKRLLKFLLLCALVFAGIVGYETFNTKAQSEPVFYFEIESDYSVLVYCDHGGNAEIVIPEYYEGYPVVAIGERAFQYCNMMKSVVMPDTVEVIGEGAFQSSNRYVEMELESITFSKNLVAIEKEAFQGCEELEDVVLPDKLSYIGEDAFEGCYLKSISIPASLETVESGGLGMVIDGEIRIQDLSAWCQMKKGYYWSQYSGVEYFEYSPFYGDTKLILNGEVLTSIVIPDDVTEIAPNAFCGYSFLESCTLPNRLQSIGEYAFEGTGLDNVSIPKSVTFIGENAFYYAEGTQGNQVFAYLQSEYAKTYMEENHIKYLEIPDSIMITKNPNRVNYHLEESFEGEGLELSGVYYDNSTRVIEEGYMISGFDSSHEGKNTINVSYLDLQASFDVLIHSANHQYDDINDYICNICNHKRAVTALQVHCTKNTYCPNELFLADSLSVTVFYDDNASGILTNSYEVSGFDSSKTGTCMLIVSFGETAENVNLAIRNAHVYSDELDDNCNECSHIRNVSKVEVHTQPQKKAYYLNEKLDITGLSIKVTYDDATEQILTKGFEVAGFDSSDEGTKTLTITYKGKTTSVAVRVLVKITSIKLVEENVSVTVGDNYQCKIIYTPSNTSETEVVWTSTNPSVATISDSGLITAVAVGTTTIRATASHGVYAECTIQVTNLKYICNVAEWAEIATGPSGMHYILKESIAVTSELEIPAGKSISIDLNGNVVVGTVPYSAVIVNNGNVTIEDSVGSGKLVQSIQSATIGAYVIENYGQFHMKNGNFLFDASYSGKTEVMYLSYVVYNLGNFVMDDGSIIMNAQAKSDEIKCWVYGVYNGSNSTFEMSDGEINVTAQLQDRSIASDVTSIIQGIKNGEGVKQVKITGGTIKCINASDLISYETDLQVFGIENHMTETMTIKNASILVGLTCTEKDLDATVAGISNANSGTIEVDSSLIYASVNSDGTTSGHSIVNMSGGTVIIGRLPESNTSNMHLRTQSTNYVDIPVYNYGNGKILIEQAYIEGSIAIYNHNYLGVIIIGLDDDVIDSNRLMIQGTLMAVKANGEVGIYDGTFVGEVDTNKVTIPQGSIWNRTVSDGVSVYTLKDDPIKLINQFVVRLYEVCLNRSPDAAGKADWSNRLQRGEISGIQAAYGFIFSNEFKGKNLCNDDYVEQLYKAFMGRASDTAGKSHWVGQLNKGSTREAVFNGFAFSQEFQNLCKQYGIRLGSGIGVPTYGTVPTGCCSVCGKEDGVTSFVKRLYSICLGRNADPVGLKDWTNKLWNHTASGSGTAYGFIFSNEFISKNYSNADYVEYLYRAFMGRASDAGGKADWVNKLNSGWTREQVFNGFAGSNEFKNICSSYGIVR